MVDDTGPPGEAGRQWAVAGADPCEAGKGALPVAADLPGRALELVQAGRPQLRRHVGGGLDDRLERTRPQQLPASLGEEAHHALVVVDRAEHAQGLLELPALLEPRRGSAVHVLAGSAVERPLREQKATEQLARRVGLGLCPLQLEEEAAPGEGGDLVAGIRDPERLEQRPV